MSPKAVSDRLTGHDLVVVIGAEVFRYYPWVPGDILPAGTELLHICADPATTGAARAGDSLLSDPRLAIERLTEMVEHGADRTRPEPVPRPRTPSTAPSSPLTPAEVHATLSAARPAHAAIVYESTSTMSDQVDWLPTMEPDSFFATASGGIGWGTPPQWA
jgi:benzoylformate decarboxylase